MLFQVTLTTVLPFCRTGYLNCVFCQYLFFVSLSLLILANTLLLGFLFLLLNPVFSCFPFSVSSQDIMSSRRSNIVEFSPAVYEFARFMAPGQEDRYLKHYLDSKDLREFPPGTFTDWSPYTSRPEQVTLPPVSNLLSPAGLPPSSPHVDPQLYLDHEVSGM